MKTLLFDPPPLPSWFIVGEFALLALRSNAAAMWRIATAASRGLVSCRGATPNPIPDRSIPSFFEGIAGGRATLRFARALQAAVDPRLDHLASVDSTFPSASSPETASEVVVSLGLASSSIAHKAREFSEGIRHYGRCYWELSKARLRFLHFPFFTIILDLNNLSTIIQLLCLGFI